MECQDKKRASYFTEPELDVLMLTYEQYKPIIAKKSNTTASAKERELAWQHITNRVNECNSGVKRTVPQVKMKYKNKIAFQKKTSRQTGEGPSPNPPQTPAEEMTVSFSKGLPVVYGIPQVTSSHTTAYDKNDLVKFTEGRFVLLDPEDPEDKQSVECDEHVETTSAVTEVDSADITIVSVSGGVHADEGPSTSSQTLSSLPADELYKVHLQKQIKKSDLEMDLIQLQMEEKTLAIKKAKLEIEMLEHSITGMKK